MQITTVKRPWEKNTRHGTRHNPDPFYQSPQWKHIRKSFRATYTQVGNIQLPNTMCIDCYKESKRFIPGKNTDHIIRRKDGGSDDHTNLQTQCDRHHAIKSAKEGNELRKHGKRYQD